jgi:hypothetical protein
MVVVAATAGCEGGSEGGADQACLEASGRFAMDVHDCSCQDEWK